MADEQGKFDPFKPAQPRIPGVTDAPRPEPEPEAPPEPPKPAPRAKFSPRVIAAGAAGALVLCIGLGWLLLRPSRPPESIMPSASETSGGPATAPTAVPAATAASSSLTTAPEVPPIYPDEVASIEELAKPWSAKRFTFLKKLTVGPIPSMLVRLPAGSARSPDAYWAFALKIPYGKCELEFVTDLDRIRNELGYRAQHPMVVDPCTNTVYDPLQRGTVSGAWVRGAVVQGSGLRPPLMLLVEIKGNRILATQIE
jgi:hypothetical protein